MNRLCRMVLIILGSILVIYSVICIITFFRNIGSYLPGLIGLFVIIFAVYYEKLMAATRSGMPKVLRIIASIGLLFLVIGFLGMCYMIYHSSKNVPEPGQDAIIVLGAGLNGEQVSLTLALRLKKHMIML